MRASPRPTATGRAARAAALGLIALAAGAGYATPQEVVRPPAPALEDFETDANKDGVPDGWYNPRDARVVAEGGVVGPKFVRFESTRPGREARLSRAFGVDGRKSEAIVIGLWVRVDQVQAGERLGQDPALTVDFLGEKLRQETRGTLGPWTARTLGAASAWTRVAKRIAVPPGTRDAIMSVGLLGATGVLEIDGLTLDLVPVGGEPTDNLVRNGGFELGDPDPTGWIADNGVRRVSPSYRSNSALEFTKAGGRGLCGLAVPLERFTAVEVALSATAAGLRGGGGASAYLYFLDDGGVPVPNRNGDRSGVPVFQWGGGFPWRDERQRVEVPRGAARAVLQFDKHDGIGSLKLDDVRVTAAPDPSAGTWTPDHVAEETGGWAPVAPSAGVAAGSALDFSFLLDPGAIKQGGVKVRDGRLHDPSGKRARFFGVQFLPPTAFVDTPRADALADRLARSGVNLVRLGELETPLGPGRGLIDDSRDDTRAFDPTALARLDHLIAALKARGVRVALELQGGRRFRADDGVPAPGTLPPGGGPASVFDPTLRRLTAEGAKALLTHVNPETGLALKDDPALAWVTLAGETSLFDLIDTPGALSGDYARQYKDLAARAGTPGVGRRFWQGLEAAHWKEQADALRKLGLNAPVAAVSHWRREPEFVEALAATGLDLVDDRIYWNAPTWVDPRDRSMLRSPDGGLELVAGRKRRADKPYVLGQWCDYTQGVWATPFEAAEQLLAAATAGSEDWDGLVRRGLFLYPEPWGTSAPGTAGGEDIFQVPEVANAAPHVYALWPHAASLFLRGSDALRGQEKAKPVARPRKGSTPGWEPDRGRLVVDTPFTQGVAGWPGGDPVTLDGVIVDVENPYAVVVASSAGPEPVAVAKRLLVTAVARVTPTGFRWADHWRRDTADPGRPPLLQEPVKATVVWRRKGKAVAYALKADGSRGEPARLTDTVDGPSLAVDGSAGTLHWELVAE